MNDDRNDFHLFILENGTWLITFLGIIGACCSGITVYFLKSRCSHIRLCWGCVDCDRTPFPANMVTIDNPRRQPITDIEIIRQN